MKDRSKPEKKHISLTIFRFANFRRISDLVLHYAFSLKAPLQAVATLGPEESRCGCWKFLVVRHVQENHGECGHPGHHIEIIYRCIHLQIHFMCSFRTPSEKSSP